MTIRAQQRRKWKLSAIKAFAERGPLINHLALRQAIGEDTFDTLLNESFLLHPEDPKAGAVWLELTLATRYQMRMDERLQRVRKSISEECAHDSGDSRSKHFRQGFSFAGTRLERGSPQSNE